MKNKIANILIGLLLSFNLSAQYALVDVEKRVFKTDKKIEIKGEIGFLEVPENRSNPKSRKIKIKYVQLKSFAKDPIAPVLYLEGGGGASTWQVNSPKDLGDWVQILELSDLIFYDRRGNGDDALNYIWKEAFPENFFVSKEAANAHYQKMAKKSLEVFKERGVDVTGYNIEEHAHDVNDLMTALGINRYLIFGFSYGSHIGMTAMKLFPERIEKAILAGSDAPNQSFNYPSYLEKHIDKLGVMVKEDAELSKDIPDFKALVNRVMKKLETTPAIVTIKHPLTKKKIDLKIGAFGLAIILRLDIDDYNDIPVIPRLLYQIDKGNYEMLTWFAQKRVLYSIGLPGGDINQQLASGASKERWDQITKEAKKSIFGNVVNFPFSAVTDTWIPNNLSFNPAIPIKSEIPTLFITGDLDCRTPVEQVEETMKGLNNAFHVIVRNAGHEQAHWDGDVADKIIPSFLKGEEIKDTDAYYADINFIKVKGKAKGHPSIK